MEQDPVRHRIQKLMAVLFVLANIFFPFTLKDDCRVRLERHASLKPRAFVGAWRPLSRCSDGIKIIVLLTTTIKSGRLGPHMN